MEPADMLVFDKEKGKIKHIDNDTAAIRAERAKHIEKKPINLAFEGGGVKGFAYSGAIFFLEEYGLTPYVKEVSGSSAGAITALFFALGCNALEIFKLMISIDFDAMGDD